MRKEFLTTEAKFVYTKNELGYQEVIDDMKNAKEITIITYNISEQYSKLINCLKSAGDDCEINIITNIPGRWDTYFGDRYRELAHKKINIYITKLDPRKIGERVSVFFNFNNHGKIIMTNNIAYVGSENYSEESANNIECGFLFKDKKFIDFLKNEILPEMKESSLSYYEDDYNKTELLLEANMILAAVFNSKNRLYEEIYRLHDDIDGEWYYYIDSEARLNQQTLDSINNVISSACEVAREIYDAIDVITSSNEDEIIVANDFYEELHTLSEKIESLTLCEPIYELAVFDTKEYINQKLQEEYSMDAYEENLNDCIDLASDDALSKICDLTEEAHVYLDKLIDTIESFEKTYSELINKFNNYNILKVNSEIDNTK